MFKGKHWRNYIGYVGFVLWLLALAYWIGEMIHG